MEWEDIKDKVYPWVKTIFTEGGAEGGKEIEVDLPMIKFLGDLGIFFVHDKGDSFEFVQRAALPAGMTEEELYEISCQNLARDIDFELTPTNYGGYGILAGGDHEAGSLCLGFIWDYCAESIGEDLIVAVPAKDMVLMVGRSQTAELEEMKKLSSHILANGERTLTGQLLLYEKEARKFSLYG